MSKEIRVYVCDCGNDNDFDFRSHEHIEDNEPIKKHAEKLGTIYSLKGFQDAINDENLNLSNSFILID